MIYLLASGYGLSTKHTKSNRRTRPPIDETRKTSQFLRVASPNDTSYIEFHVSPRTDSNHKIYFKTLLPSIRHVYKTIEGSRQNIRQLLLSHKQKTRQKGFRKPSSYLCYSLFGDSLFHQTHVEQMMECLLLFSHSHFRSILMGG